MRFLRRLFLALIALTGVGLYLAWRNRRQIFAEQLKLPPVQNDVKVTRAIPVTMPDGVKLMTDHYAPQGSGDFPTILIRTPYGRGYDAIPMGFLSIMMCERYAERGYHVVVQTTRGQYDSGGHFVPFAHEKDDGLATIDWIKQQDWYNGSLAMWGQSYLGLVQWQVAADAPDDLKAIFPVITGTYLRDLTYADDAFALELSLRWAMVVAGSAQGVVEREIDFWQHMDNLINTDESVEAGYKTLPLRAADKASIGQHVNFYQDWMDTQGDPQSAFWQDVDFSANVVNAKPRAHLLAGWYDIFLNLQLKDYAALVENDKAPYLTVGPWGHMDLEINVVALRESLAWFDAHLKADVSKLRDKPVKLFVMGAEEWREMDHFPPKAEETRFYLHAGGGMIKGAPDYDDKHSTFTYDPANPTPAVGGIRFSMEAGRADNRELEARDDVLVFDSYLMTEPMEFIGRVAAELYVSSSSAHTDFFVRINDVAPGGASLNICDGLFRITPEKGEVLPDGSRKICVDMWATAYQLKTGHRLRVLVASGAHPRWSRNTGSGEAIADATQLCQQHQTLHHDAKHPSCVILPVTN